MEIKSELQKPYTEDERLNFIIEENSQNGYEIKETETALEAWGYTQAEKEQQKQERIENLQCTKRVFILMLEQLGLDYFEQIEPAINANRQAKLEWELCVELQRKNPLLDQLPSSSARAFSPPAAWRCARAPACPDTRSWSRRCRRTSARPGRY